MPKNKILFVITKGSPFGGAQQYVYDLITHAPKDIEPVLGCGAGDELPNALRGKGIKVIELENLQREVHAKSDLKTLIELIKVIEFERPKIINFNSSKGGFLGALAYLYIKIINFLRKNLLPKDWDNSYEVKAVFTAHGWAFNETNRPFLARIIFYIAHWLTIVICDKTIAVSEKSKKEIDWLPFLKNKMTTIHNGMIKFKTRTKKEARDILLNHENTEIDHKKTIIFSISELHHNKGIDIALEAMARFPEHMKEKMIYAIAGTGEEKENLTELSEKLGVSKMVKFLGFVPNAKELLNGADIFLLPSRTDMFPYAVLEAGMVGLPIIATSVGGVPEIISDMQDGILVHRRNPREISEAIIYILENPERRRMFREKIKEKIATQFSIEKMISETYSLYKSLAPNI